MDQDTLTKVRNGGDLTVSEGKLLTDSVREVLQNDIVKARVVKAIIERAESGDVAMLKLIWSYLEGMPNQTQEIKQTNVNINSVWTPEQLMEARKRVEVLNKI